MNSLPKPILELVISFISSGSNEDKKNIALVSKIWLQCVRKIINPTISLCYASIIGDLKVVVELLQDKSIIFFIKK